ncbi:hypothetical protein D3C78_1785860 [compost metagenome]
MHELRVIAVGLVLDDELPVGLGLVLKETGSDFDLALRRGLHQRIERRASPSQVFLEAGPLLGETTEDEPLIDANARDLA